MMNMPCENGMTGAFEEFVGREQSATMARGMLGNLSELECMGEELSRADFKIGKPLLPGIEDGVRRHSGRKWGEGNCAEEPVYFDGLNARHKKTPVDIKELILWVRIIAQKIHRPLPSNIMLNDLVQDGMIGLIMALKEHDADNGIPFHAYAANKIRWAIMDGLRAGDWAEKSVRARANKVTKTAERLQALLQRSPSMSEIANSLGVSLDDITTTLGNAYGYNFVRINDSVEGEAQDIPDSRMEPSAIVERREVSSRAVAGLRTLLPNERKAFILRIMCDMSVMQAATEMGVSESRVSQLYKSASRKLADYVSHRKPQMQ